MWFAQLLAFLPLVLADITPTLPGPTDTFKAGDVCRIAWTPDSTGTWSNVTIVLRSGSNANMTFVTTVVTALDGTKRDSYEWPCPEVNPYSKIYFYQFTNSDDEESSQWTTRFTITSPDGETASPAHETQPDGEAIPWGNGQLVSSSNQSQADPEAGSKAEETMSATTTSEAPSTSQSTATSSRMHKARPTDWNPDTIIPAGTPSEGQVEKSSENEGTPSSHDGYPIHPYSQTNEQQQAPYAHWSSYGYQDRPPPAAYPASPYGQGKSPYIQAINASARAQSLQWMAILSVPLLQSLFTL